MADLDPLGIGTRLGQLGESAAREIADALLEAPAFSQTIASALGVGEQAQVASRQALGALNISSKDDLERVERRLRAALSRLDELEDRLDELADQIGSLQRPRGEGPGGAVEPDVG